MLRTAATLAFMLLHLSLGSAEEFTHAPRLNHDKAAAARTAEILEAQAKQIYDAYFKGNFTAIAKYYHPKARHIAADGTTYHGKGEVMKYLRCMKRNSPSNTLDIDLHVEQIWDRGDVIITDSVATINNNTALQPTTTYTARKLTVFQRTHGKYLVLVDSWFRGDGSEGNNTKGEDMVDAQLSELLADTGKDPVVDIDSGTIFIRSSGRRDNGREAVQSYPSRNESNKWPEDEESVAFEGNTTRIEIATDKSKQSTRRLTITKKNTQADAHPIIQATFQREVQVNARKDEEEEAMKRKRC